MSGQSRSGQSEGAKVDVVHPFLKPSGAVVDSTRVSAVDILRGFIIVSIIGLDGIAWAMREMARGSASHLARLARAFGDQFSHAHWEGLTFYDLILPLFVFVTGVSVVFSLRRYKASGSMRIALPRVVRRFAILFVLGLILYGGAMASWPDIRLLGVLQRIAICYLVASLLYLMLGSKGIIIAIALLLAGYWALLTFVPVPGVGAPSYAKGLNLANWIDLHYLPGKLWYRTWDPEGLLSTLPAIASCLMGVLAGHELIRSDHSGTAKSMRLLCAGLVLLLGGYIWSLQFPIIKSIWTSSFALVCGGYSFMLLAVLHYIADVRGKQLWARPLMWVGANAITLYFANSILSFESFARRLVGGDIAGFLDRIWAPGAGRLVSYAAGLLIAVLLARYLYSRRIFVRV